KSYTGHGPCLYLRPSTNLRKISGVIVYPVTDTDLTLPLYAVNWHPSHFDANVFDERDSMMSVNLNAVSRSDFQ
ncbi:hypothetical protein ABG941_09850, partial [Bifidobacterium longum]